MHALQGQKEKGSWKRALMEDLMQDLGPASAAATAGAPLEAQGKRGSDASACAEQALTAVDLPVACASAHAEAALPQDGAAAAEEAAGRPEERQQGYQDDGPMQAAAEEGGEAGDARSEDGGLSAMLEAELASQGEVDESDEDAQQQPQQQEPQREGIFAAAACPAQCKVQYELWRLGELRVVTRAKVRAALPADLATRTPAQGVQVSAPSLLPTLPIVDHASIHGGPSVLVLLRAALRVACATGAWSLQMLPVRGALDDA